VATFFATKALRHKGGHEEFPAAHLMTFAFMKHRMAKTNITICKPINTYLATVCHVLKGVGRFHSLRIFKIIPDKKVSDVSIRQHGICIMKKSSYQPGL
jgi:hypothetical protein